MAIWDKLFKGKQPPAATPIISKTAEPAPAEPAETAETAEADYEERDADDRVYEATFEARDRFWKQVGKLEGDVIAHILSPIFFGGPSWPTTRQATQVVRRGSSIILATDGMADPFDDGEPLNGFGHELFVETTDIPQPLQGEGNVADLADTWAYKILAGAADLAASRGGLSELLAKYGSMSTDLADADKVPCITSQVPGRFFSPEGNLGILFGGVEPDFPSLMEGMPLSPVRAVPVILITAAELTVLREHGLKGRQELVRRLARTPSGHRSDLTRPSLF